MGFNSGFKGLMLNHSYFSIHGRVCWRIKHFRVLSLSGHMCGMIGHCRILILSGCMFRRIRHCRKLSPSGCICRRMSWGRMLSPRSTCARGSVTLCAVVVGVTDIGANFVEVVIQGLLLTEFFSLLFNIFIYPIHDIRYTPNIMIHIFS